MWPLNLIRWKKATGVLIGNETVTLTVAAATAGGVQVLKTQEAAIGEGGVRATLTELSESKKGLPGLVVTGLDARQTYYSTKPAQPDTAEESLDLLPPALAASSKYVSHHVDVKMRKQGFMSVGACGRAVARDVLAGLRGVKSTRMRLEPAPCAVHGTARRLGKLPRRWRCVVRVLLDGSQGLAYLELAGKPLAWRPFRFPGDKAAPAVATAVRGLRAFGRSELEIDDVDGVVVHENGDIAELQEDCEEHCGMEVRLQKPVALDEASVAGYLASAGLRSRASAPDMLTKLKPPPTIRDIFPWGTALILLLAVLGTGYELSGTADRVESQTRMAKAQMKLDAMKARVKVSDLKKKHGELSLELELLYNFVVKRVAWAEVLQELPRRVPGAVVLVGVRGRDSFTMPSATKSGVRKLETKEVSLQGQGRLASGKAAPVDITALMESLAASEIITKSFPRVDGANVIRKPGKEIDAVTFVAKCSKPKW
ncbi:MAG: hypothetical protein QNJ90_07605 [Planctomycetota bacterium]|nr:hypothetical protein [Planctomycetota bacterium]